VMLDFSHKRSIFRDEAQMRHFNEEGYIIVPFLSEAHIAELTELYREFYPEGVKGFFTTTFANNVEHREKVNASIRELCRARIEELFADYKILFSSFIVKAPGPESELIVHQDMTLVDESIFNGINIWCPLVDLTTENGAIQLLPRSHRLFNTYRGSSIPDIYDDVVPEVKQLMQSLYLKAGEAVIFDQSIIHYSPPNLSTEERPVINTFVAHKEAVIKVCYWDKENYGQQIEIFDQGDDFLEKFENFGHNIFNRPEIGTSLGLFPYDFPKLTVQRLEQEYGVNLTPPAQKIETKKASWFARLFSGTNA
jgi:ectoine hydroxylase-related dioxygenase (phytanoyl-CoA dioxygenase family)